MLARLKSWSAYIASLDRDKGNDSMSRYISACDLGIVMTADDEDALFKWFLASFLFGKRIGRKIAATTWRALVNTHGRDTPRKLANMHACRTA